MTRPCRVARLRALPAEKPCKFDKALHFMANVCVKRVARYVFGTQKPAVKHPFGAFSAVWQGLSRPLTHDQDKGGMPPFLNQSRTKVSPLDEDQGLGPEDHQRASELSGHMANPARFGCAPRFRPWMTTGDHPGPANVSTLEPEEAFRRSTPAGDAPAQ